MRGPGYTPEQLAYIRENAQQMSDVAMGKVLGFKSSKVLHIRKRNGIAGRPSQWTPERIEQVRALYIDQGLTSDEAGAVVGVSGKTVRMLCRTHAWNRDPRIAALNLRKTEASRHAKARRQARNRAAKARREAAAMKAAAERATMNDADLVADFINRKGVTIVPPGQACGLTRIEAVFGAYKPPATWHEQRVIAHKNAAVSTIYRNSGDGRSGPLDQVREPDNHEEGSGRRANASPVLTSAS